MSKYELVVVLSPEDKELKKKVDALVKEAGFSVSEEEDMGVKTLAYTIGKQESAKYFKLILEGEGSGVKKLEFNLNLEDGVLRYLTIALTPKLEKVRAEMAVVRAEIQAKAKKNEKLDRNSDSKDKSERS
jgi:small subunit ribosomal protein S6